MSNEASKRHTLGSKTGLTIEPSRVRLYLERFDVNSGASGDIRKLNEKIFAIRKQGGPKNPAVAAPRLKWPGRKANETEILNYKKSKEAYEKAEKAYNLYKSPRYASLILYHSAYKNLTHLQELLEMRNNPQHNGVLKPTKQKEFEAVLNRLNDVPRARREGETEEHYKKCQTRYTVTGHKQLLAGVDLKDVAAIKAFREQLLNRDPDLQLFLERDKSSADRVRIGEKGIVVITAAIERMVFDVLRCAALTTLKENKKILKPDHCVNEEVVGTPLYALLNHLPHYLMIVERLKRSQEYKAVYLCEYEKKVAQERVKAKRAGTTYRKSAEPKVSFNDMEVKGGFATVTEEATEITEGDKKKIKVHRTYKWPGIDTGKEKEGDINFRYYVGRLAIRAREAAAALNVQCANVRISDSVKTALSNIVMDAIQRISQVITLLMEDVGEKKGKEPADDNLRLRTVSGGIAKQALRIILSGNPMKEHEAFFTELEAKLKLCEDDSATPAEELEAEEEAADEATEVIEEEADEEPAEDEPDTAALVPAVPLPVVAPVKPIVLEGTPKRRAPVTK